MIKKDDIIFKNLHGRDDPFLKCAIKRGDWKDTKKILKTNPQDIINTIKESGLRGRGVLAFQLV